MISRKRNSLKSNADIDWGLYRYRHWVENAFARLKQYWAIATRYDKLKRNYESMVAMARVDICGYYLCEMSTDSRNIKNSYLASQFPADRANRQFFVSRPNQL